MNYESYVDRLEQRFGLLCLLRQPGPPYLSPPINTTYLSPPHQYYLPLSTPSMLPTSLHPHPHCPLSSYSQSPCPLSSHFSTIPTHMYNRAPSLAALMMCGVCQCYQCSKAICCCMIGVSEITCSYITFVYSNIIKICENMENISN